MSTALLIKSINEHAIRQREQLGEVHRQFNILLDALVHITTLHRDAPKGKEFDGRIRSALGEIASAAINAVKEEEGKCGDL